MTQRVKDWVGVLGLVALVVIALWLRRKPQASVKLTYDMGAGPIAGTRLCRYSTGRSIEWPINEHCPLTFEGGVLVEDLNHT